MMCVCVCVCACVWAYDAQGKELGLSVDGGLAIGPSMFAQFMSEYSQLPCRIGFGKWPSARRAVACAKEVRAMPGGIWRQPAQSGNG